MEDPGVLTVPALLELSGVGCGGRVNTQMVAYILREDMCCEENEKVWLDKSISAKMGQGGPL
jgi:hypothetical protein